MATGFKNQSAGGMGFDPRSSDPVNPKAGDIQVSDGTVRAKGLWEYKNGGWSQVGAGNTDLAVYRQFDAEDGDINGFTNITISSSSPLNKLNSYVVNSYTANFPAITLFERHKDKLHGVELHYKMTSGTARLVVKDNASNTLVSQEISSTVAQKVSLQFYVNSAVTSVQLFIEDVSSATGLKIDDVKFTDNPFVAVDFKVVNSVNLSGNDGRAITANTESLFWSGTGVGWTSGADGSTLSSGNYYSVQSPNSVIKIVGVVSATTNGTRYISIYKNGSLYKSVATFTTSNVHTINFLSSKGEFVLGDKLSFAIDVGITLLNSATHHYLSIIEEAESEHVVTPASAGTEYYAINAQTSNFWDGTGNQDTFDISLIPLTTSKLLEWEDTTETRLKAKKDCIVDVSITASSSGAGSNILIFNSSGVAIAVTPTYANTYISSAHAEIKLRAGEYIYFQQTSLLNRNGGIRIAARPAEANFLAAIPVQQVAYLKDVKSSGTAGGTFTSGSYQTRTLNTVEGDSFASLSANQFTLPAGTYDIEITSPAYFVGMHKAKLRNISDSTDSIVGSTAYAEAAGNGDQTVSIVFGRVTITSSKVFEVQHRCGSTRLTNGFGDATGFGDSEVYTQVKITKLR